jgi:hypothetical protein
MTGDIVPAAPKNCCPATNHIGYYYSHEQPSRFPAYVPDFTPVPRQTVSHGRTAAKHRDFIAALAATGSVRMATEACGMSHCGVYKVPDAKDEGSFASAWDIAVGMGAARIRDVLFDHTIHAGPETVIVDKKTRIEQRRYNDRTMIWALQHDMPDQYVGAAKLPAKPKPWPEPSDPDAARATS